MVTQPGDPERDGSVVLMMLGIAVLGVAAFVGLVEPASRELRTTRENEKALEEQIRKEEQNRARLQLVDHGLQNGDAAIVERKQREQGRGGKDEIRYARPDSVPADRQSR